MTDNEIIKAFESYNWYDDKDITKTCVKSVLLKNAYYLMCRQQAEIEKFERTVSHLEDYCNSIPDKVRAEAIKEFAEKFVEQAGTAVEVDNGKELYETKTYTIMATDFDNIVKEMTDHFREVTK